MAQSIVTRQEEEDEADKERKEVPDKEHIEAHLVEIVDGLVSVELGKIAATFNKEEPYKWIIYELDPDLGGMYVVL